MFKKTDLERHKNGYTRSIQQNEILAESGKSKDGSASKYAMATELFLTNIPWEWLHLIAHEIAGAATQKLENLVGGTKHANTDMMFIESQLRYLAKAYPEGFNLHVKANLMKKTNSDNKSEYLQIATTIEYNIITPDFTLPFIFNAQNETEPHIAFGKYISAFVKALVQHHQNQSKTDIKSHPQHK